MLDEWMNKLQKELELKGPLGEPGGSYSILLDDTRIEIGPVQSGFHFTATLGDLPKESPELFFIKLLRGNFLGQASYGGFLGLDETGTKIMLRYFHPDKTDWAEFKGDLEDFMNGIDFWKNEVSSHAKEPNKP